VTAPADLDFAALLRAGDTVAWSGTAAEPCALLERLDAQLPRLPRTRALIGFGLGTLPDAARLARHMDVCALGGAGSNRRLAPAGRLDVLPANYHALSLQAARGELRIDVVLVQLAGDGDAVHVALQHDYVAAAIPHARVVVAEINDRAPLVAGEPALDPADVDVTVRASHPPVAWQAPRPSHAARAIAAHVARLVPHGATLQVGLGAIPDAVLEALAAHRDLGVHSGVIGDRIADLMRCGAITNRRKPLDGGLTVTNALLGSEALYRFAHRNPRLALRATRYTHDLAVLGAIPDLIGINSALEVDLTGQVNAEVAAGRHAGLIGGHADFLRGCLRSEGGRGIVALESTARGGALSRIVPSLAGGVVTTPRADADVVVTEHGIAELRGKTIFERAEALIAVAAPDFRDALRAAAGRLC